MSNKAVVKQDAKPTLTPKLRFPEFRGAVGWEQRPLGLACQMQAGKFVSASEIRAQYAPGLYPCYGGNGLRGYTATFTHSGKYSLIGRQGALCGNVKVGIGQFHATEHAVVVTPENGIVSDWLFFVLDLLNMNRFATGQAQPGLSVDVLEKLPIAIPNEKSEQQKIAECLTSLDEVIAAQSQKLAALKTHKKGLMQQLFPREGETQPRLRFPEFQDAPRWRAETGDSLFDQMTERNPEPGLPVLAITQEHGAIPRHLIDYHVSVTEKSIESYKVVQVGDFIISLRSFQGGIEYSQYHGICSPAYVILRRRIEGNDDYFKQYLKTERFIQILTKNLEGLRDGKMISYKQFSELLLPIPSPAEQQKIAECLTSLDEVIAAQSQKLDALKTHKKGLMQQLFPSPEAVEA